MRRERLNTKRVIVRGAGDGGWGQRGGKSFRATEIGEGGPRVVSWSMSEKEMIEESKKVDGVGLVDMDGQETQYWLDMRRFRPVRSGNRGVGGSRMWRIAYRRGFSWLNRGGRRNL